MSLSHSFPKKETIILACRVVLRIKENNVHKKLNKVKIMLSFSTDPTGLQSLCFLVLISSQIPKISVQMALSELGEISTYLQ